MIARHTHLQINILFDGLHRLLVGTQRLQWLKPNIQQVLQHGDIQVFLRRKVVQQISFGNVRPLGYLIEAGAVNTV